MDTFYLGLFWYAAFLFSLTVHEAAHAWAARRGGDLTAYHGGQVTLDPLPHIRREPLGTIVVPIVSFLLSKWMIGWASTPYDPLWAERYPRRAGWMALAGPAANFLIVGLAAAGLRIGLAAGWFVPPAQIAMHRVVDGVAGQAWAAPAATLLSILFMLNLILAVFNLMPVPPLDGGSALALVLPEGAARKYRAVLGHPGFLFLGLFLAWKLFPFLFSPVFAVALRLLHPDVVYQ